MHVLDDPAGLSPRAWAFLRSAATREPPPARLPVAPRQLPNRAGRAAAPSPRPAEAAEAAVPAEVAESAVPAEAAEAAVPAEVAESAVPAEVAVARKGFAARFGGLRYDVRRSLRIGDERVDVVRRWRFALLDVVRAEHSGWSFGWSGEQVSAPVAHLVHIDGRVGVHAGGPFLEVSPSVHHLIESHALLDELHDWEPLPPGSPEAGVPWSDPAELVDGLPPVPEASGPCDRWWRSEELAVRRFHGWTDARPRPTGVMIWRRPRV